MAAYCRVSTDQEEQLLSYENQVNYYTKFIKDNLLYTFAGVYADEGISATNTKKREEFNRMIADCREGKIDMIITKSISRFARNTLDCLNYVRELKELGIGILFEKENINTLDAKGEVLLTILSSLAQDESRSISENSTWGIRRRFEAGKHKMSTKRFLGYDSDETGKLIVNSRQAKIVVRLFQEFLDGKTTDYIKRIFEWEGMVNWDGSTKWHATTMNSMLQNKKYVKTINHYKLLVNNLNDLYVGGIMASLMTDKVMAATGIERSHILTGLFTDTSVVGDDNDINVDELPLWLP